MEESILSEGISLKSERNGKNGLYDNECNSLIVVEILCWGEVLKVIDVSHLLNASNTYLSL